MFVANLVLTYFEDMSLRPKVLASRIYGKLIRNLEILENTRSNTVYVRFKAGEKPIFTHALNTAVEIITF